MHILLFALGIGQIFYSVSVFAEVESVMHQIFAAQLFGFGAVCVGLAAVLEAQKKALAASKDAEATRSAGTQ